eukprot:365145-Chlamydomonas_euryale.AAC.5
MLNSRSRWRHQHSHLGILIVVATARNLHTDAGGDVLDALAPHRLVQLHVEAHIRGAHHLRGKLADLRACLSSGGVRRAHMGGGVPARSVVRQLVPCGSLQRMPRCNVQQTYLLDSLRRLLLEGRLVAPLVQVDGVLPGHHILGLALALGHLQPTQNFAVWYRIIQSEKLSPSQVRSSRFGVADGHRHRAATAPKLEAINSVPVHITAAKHILQLLLRDALLWQWRPRGRWQQGGRHSPGRRRRTLLPVAQAHAVDILTLLATN